MSIPTRRSVCRYNFYRQVSNPPTVTLSFSMETPIDPPSGSESTGATDGLLVRKVLAGDRKAYDELVRKYQRQAIAVSYRLLGNTQDALEVTQDAFLKGFTSLDTLQKPEAFGGWLMRIVSNLSLNYRRSREVRQQGQLPLDDLFGERSGDATDSAGGGSE